MQEYHPKPDALERIQDPEPEPQTAARDRGAEMAARPGDVDADARDAPEHLGPAGRAEADGEDGQDPGVGLAQAVEDVEDGGPEQREEEEHQAHDGPAGGVLRGPQVQPVAAVGGGEEEILDEDSEEEPQHDFAAEDAAEEVVRVAGGLAVVRGQALVEEDADGPEEDGNAPADCDCRGRMGDEERGRGGAGDGGLGDVGAPPPECGDVDLLGSLDDAGAEDPGGDGRAALVAEVEGEEEGAGARCDGVAGRCDVLDPVLAVGCVGEGRTPDEKEGEAVEEEREAEDVEGLVGAVDRPPQHGRDEIDGRDDIELRGGFTDCACQERDLVAVGGDDLAEGEEDAVQRPVAEFEEQQFLAALGGFVVVVDCEFNFGVNRIDGAFVTVVDEGLDGGGPCA